MNVICGKVNVIPAKAKPVCRVPASSAHAPGRSVGRCDVAVAVIVDAVDVDVLARGGRDRQPKPEADGGVEQRRREARPGARWDGVEKGPSVRLADGDGANHLPPRRLADQPLEPAYPLRVMNDRGPATLCVL